jgi:hypothetical protein
MPEFTPQFEDWFRPRIEAMKPEKKRAVSGQIDTKHFDSMPDDLKKQVLDEANRTASLNKW